MGISFGLHSVTPLIISLLLMLVALLCMPRRKSATITIGTLLLCIAAGAPYLTLPKHGNVVVLTDFSQSTRGATYRDENSLQQRLTQLLKNTNYKLVKFEGHDHTIFAPPSGADAIVLFSDGQFSSSTPPNAPVYCVLDPNLNHISDGRITSAEIIGNQLIAHIENTGQPRQVRTSDGETREIGEGSFDLTFPTPAKTARIEISGNDLWPENNSLTALASPGSNTQRWWIGPSNPGGDWKVLSALPTDLSDYLATSVIVLEDQPADKIPPIARQKLEQYVRDLGGGLVILGGNHAFADYAGTELDVLSPLTASSPESHRQWVILLDASGSMGEKWPAVLSAQREMLRAIPPTDFVTLGSFSSTTRWWTSATAAKISHDIPADVSPHGPTNLPGAIESIASRGPCDAVIITDAQGDTGNISEQITKLRSAKVHLSALVLGTESPALDRLVTATGGEILSEADPSKWNSALRGLVHHTIGSRLSYDPVTIRFIADLHTIVGRNLAQWNRLWLKSAATPLAIVEGSTKPLAASWQLGLGHVAALATSATHQEALALTDLVERAPADPRFSLQWQLTDQLKAIVDSTATGSYINNATIKLEINNHRTPFTQTAPGKYEAALPYPSFNTLATVYADDHILGRRMIPQRYLEEFRALGTNHEILQSLAKQTGGAIIEPSQQSAINFHWPRHDFDLTAIFALTGALLIAAKLALRRALV